MLAELRIKNLAIIDELSVTFNDGLSVITGETGAGKSIIIGAVNLLLGDRASNDLIRSGEDAAEVEALFDAGENESLKSLVARMGLPDDGELVLKRIISRTGKNRAYINGSPATLAMLTSITEHLVNICGQHEHQLMLNAENHIDILDEFAGLLPERSSFTELYGTYREIERRLDDLKSAEREKSAKEELLRFQLREIDEARLKEGEDQALQDEKRIGAHARKLQEHAARAYELLYGEEGSVVEHAGRIISLVREIRKIDSSLALSDADMESVSAMLDDMALSLREYMNRVSFDPARLEEIDNRLELIGRMKRKYGGSIGDIHAARSRMEEELQRITSLEETIRELSLRIADVETSLTEKARALSRRRKEAAVRLERAIVKEVRSLKMQHASFSVRVTAPEGAAQAPAFHERGIDAVEFFMSTNVGEELKPMNRIASGGELSRIMLAVKKVLARTGSVGTVIFDEVDSGIGGAVAEVVGKKMKDVAVNHQVICITHLPQIACFGDAHFLVSKEAARGRTQVKMCRLADAERHDEITRMLGGVTITEATREHASEMLKASRRKEK